MSDKEYYEVIQKYEPMMHKFLKRFKIQNDYEDILQELRLVAWQTIKKHDPNKATFTTFIYNRFKNYLVTKLKQEKKLQKLGKDYKRSWKENIPYNLKHPDYINDLTFEQQINVLKQSNSAEDIRLGIDLGLFKNSLNDIDNEILKLKAQGLNQKEIGKELGIDRSTISKRLNKLRTAFKIYIKEGKL